MQSFLCMCNCLSCQNINLSLKSYNFTSSDASQKPHKRQEIGQKVHVYEKHFQSRYAFFSSFSQSLHVKQGHCGAYVLQYLQYAFISSPGTAIICSIILHFCIS